jgi:hypothetical protein
VRVQQKVRTHLVAHGRWSDLERAQRFFRREGSIPTTAIRGNQVAMADDLSGVLSEPVSAEVLLLSASESRLQVCAEHAEWLTPSTLRLTGWAVVRGIDLSERHPRLAAWLVADDGRRLDLPVERVPSAAATRWVAWAHGSFDQAGFRMLIDADALEGNGPWRLEVRVEVDGVVREGGVHHAVEGSSASRGSIGRLAAVVGARLVPRFHSEHGLVLARPGMRHRIRAVLSSIRAPVQVTGVDAADGRLQLHTSGRFRTSAIKNAATRIDGAVDAKRRITIPLRRADGQALPSGAWRVLADGKAAALTPVLAQRLPQDVLTPTHRVRLTLDRGRRLALELEAPLTDDELGVRAQHLLQVAYAKDHGDPEAGILLIGDDGGALSGPVAGFTAAAAATGMSRWAAVADLATPVPGGTKPVIIGSRAWYERLAVATLIVTTRDLEWWFVKRQHQRVVRVFLESDVLVGRTAWWDAGFTPGHIADELARAAQWDAIVVPDAGEVARYRDELAYLGTVYTAQTSTARILAQLTDAS